MASFVRTAEGVVINLDLVTHAEVDGKNLVLHVAGHAHKVAFASHAEAERVLGGFTDPTRTPAIERMPRHTR